MPLHLGFAARDFGPSQMLKMVMDYAEKKRFLVSSWLRTDYKNFPEIDFNIKFPNICLNDINFLFVGIHAFNNLVERELIIKAKRLNLKVVVIEDMILSHQRLLEESSFIDHIDYLFLSTKDSADDLQIKFPWHRGLKYFGPPLHWKKLYDEITNTNRQNIFFTSGDQTIQLTKNHKLLLWIGGKNSALNNLMIESLGTITHSLNGSLGPFVMVANTHPGEKSLISASDQKERVEIFNRLRNSELPHLSPQDIENQQLSTTQLFGISYLSLSGDGSTLNIGGVYSRKIMIHLDHPITSDNLKKLGYENGDWSLATSGAMASCQLESLANQIVKFTHEKARNDLIKKQELLYPFPQQWLNAEKIIAETVGTGIY